MKEMYFYNYVTHVFEGLDTVEEDAVLPDDYPATLIPPPEAREFYDIVFNNGAWEYRLQDLTKIQKEITDAVQKHLDDTAQERGYDSIFTCIGYSGSTVPQFRNEAQAALEWRDSVWLKCHELLDKFKKGELEVMTSEEVIETLPKIAWPQAE